MCSISNQDKQVIIENLEKIDSELKGESKRFGNAKESVTVGRRKPVVEGVLEHLKSSSTTNYNIMIDAETGFGKTYDIGLHSYVLAQAGFHHLVAVPNNNLVNQAKKMIGDAFSLRIETPETTQEIEDLLKNTEPTTIIITHDLLLQQKDGQKLGNRSGEKPKLWISIDEADSISQQQAFENMCQLDRKYPTTYLTATTKRRILSRCGKIISPARSSRCCIVDTIRTTGIIKKTNGEKFGRILATGVAFYVISSIVLFPIINIHVTAIATQIGFTSNLRLYLFLINSSKHIISVIVFFMIMAPVMWVFSKIAGVELKQLFLRAIANLFEVLSSQCKSSPAHEYIEKCEETFYHNKLVDTDDLLTSVRWNIQSPIGENALILTYDLDSIMNLISIFQGKDDEVYENGKTYTRYSIYNLCKPDKMLYKDYRLKLRQSNFINCVKKQYSNLTEEQISELSEKVDFSDTHKYLKYRAMHSMIDLTLSFLMECDNIALDKQRREDLSRLTRSVKGKISVVDDGKVVDFLKKKGFDEEFAQDKLLPQIKTVIEALGKCDNEQCKLIVDNWHLSKEMHDLIERKEGVLQSLNSFCEDNMCIFVGLKRDYLGIEKDKSLKISKLNGKYSVKYCDYSQGNVNALAKCALTTVVDGSKGRGFDSEYNHVASIFTDSASQFNDPAEALQNLGRNRERNTSRQSWFFAVAGEKVGLFVDKVLAKLKSPPRYFCQKVLFPAVDRYSKLVKNRMGVELGAKMEIYISENMDALGNINDKDLQDFSYGLIKEAYEKVHDMNDFDVEKTEKDLRKIAKSTEEYLRSYRNRIINNGKPLFLQRVLFFVLTTITKAAYYINFAFDYVIFLAKSYTLNEKDDEKVLAYAYVIRHCSLESFLKCSSIIREHFKLLQEKVENLQKKYTLKEPLELLTNGLQNAGEKERLVKLLETTVGLLQNEMHIEALDKSVYSLLSTKEGKKCLSTILNTIYSQDNNNDNKLKKIIDFKKNLSEFSNFLKNIKNSSLEDLEQVYSSSKDLEQVYNSLKDLKQVYKWICEINQEIINCQAYYHNINTLFGFGEPKLKTDHPLFNIRTVYNKETFTNSYGKLHNSHSKLLFFAKFNYMARYVIVISLSLLPLALTDSLIAQVISFLVVSAMLLMDYNYPEASRGLIFCANIQNDSRSAVNELSLLSKQFEVECVDKVANDIPVHLSSILTQQISSGIETVYT